MAKKLNADYTGDISDNYIKLCEFYNDIKKIKIE